MQFRLILRFTLLFGFHVKYKSNINISIEGIDQTKKTKLLQFFIIMQGNFSINLPSIPSSTMKFKIQDVRLKGFLAKEARFKDDKTYLTKRFLNSFPNLIQKTERKSQQTQENKSQLSTLSSIIPKEEQAPFRWMIGDDKKNLLIKYEEKYKSYNSPISSQFINQKGFSFGKQGLKDALDGEMNKYKSVALEAENKETIENYFFHQTVQSDSDEELQREIRREQKLMHHKKVQQSPVFKSQDRWKFGDRLLSSQIKPGPGSYLKETKKKIDRKLHKQSNPEIQGFDLKKIKRILGQFSPEKIEEEQKVTNKKSHKQRINHTSNFILGNHDRFGSQVYPVSNKINVPGPGSYQFHNSLEQNANRILILEEQRKLLKEWNDS